MAGTSGASHHVVFLGGLFLEEQQELIERGSRGWVQNAADAHQKALIKGLLLTHQGPISLLNLPFVGSYPRLFKKKRFPSFKGHLDRALVTGPSFITIQGIKILSRFWSALIGLLTVARFRNETIVIYSAHLPFIIAALIFRSVFRRSRICLVLPDFPEFMGEGGVAYRFIKGTETVIFYWLTRYLDGFVLLTRHMAERLSLSGDRFTVIEGIADVSEVPQVPQESDIVFLYTGTLAARYGVKDLIAAFQHMTHKNVQLWIAGDGDSRNNIVAAAKADRRIRFFGQVTRDAALRLQSQAVVLINPRSPEGEFTRYSFPSKTMEYMAAGRAVIMHRLAGVPDEYFQYVIAPDSADVAGLARAMDQAAEMGREQLSALGEQAQSFVAREKSPKAQGRKLTAFLETLA